MASSQYEQQARERKAASIVGHLRAKGITSDSMATMHPQELSNHIVAAGHTSASKDTMSLVQSSMEHLDKYAERHAEDPFAGL